MPRILDLGSRIELVPMDSHCGEISVALYRREESGGPEFLVHTYSSRDGADERVRFISAGMKTLGNVEDSAANPGCLRFPCGSGHELACRRLFLEVCKLPTGSDFVPRPLSVFDKKAGKEMAAVSEGEGLYTVSADDPGESMTLRRVAATAGGLAKLGEMEPACERRDRVRFACGRSHDNLVALLLPRALNVRTAMREAEAAAARGVLSAPSAQDS